MLGSFSLLSPLLKFVQSSLNGLRLLMGTFKDANRKWVWLHVHVLLKKCISLPTIKIQSYEVLKDLSILLSRFFVATPYQFSTDCAAVILQWPFKCLPLMDCCIYNLPYCFHFCFFNFGFNTRHFLPRIDVLQVPHPVIYHLAGRYLHSMVYRYKNSQALDIVILT